MLGNTITRAMTVCGNARVILINSREMVDDAIRIHHLSPTARPLWDARSQPPP